MITHRNLALAAALALAWAAPKGAAAEPPSESGQGWAVEVTPYLLITGLHGDFGLIQAIPPVHVGLTPIDVFSSLRFGFMGAIQVRHDRFVALSDNIYAHNKFHKHVGIRDPDFLTVNVTSKMFISTDMVGIRFYDPATHGGVAIDALAGARVYNIDNGLDLIGPRRVFNGDHTEFWVDPLIGVRAMAPIRGRLSWSLYGDVGGFGAGSRLSGEIFGSLKYAFDRHWSSVIGWRYLYTDYKHEGFVYKTTLNGPLLGVTYRF
jgi:hypothetical protein